MKVLLVNNNPVVGKQVTLSAQKTGDELQSAVSLEEVESGAYDLLVMDDTSFDEEQFAAFKERVTYSQSCFIGARNSQKPEGFTRVLNKPFLPTDLVEIFSNVSQSGSTNMPEDTSDDEPIDTLEEVTLSEGLDSLDDLEELESFDEGEEVVSAAALADDDLGDILDLESELDAIENLDDAIDEFEESTGGLVEEHESEGSEESVLDADDLQEVKELLEETDEPLDEIGNLGEILDEQASGSTLGNDATIDEINDVLESLEEEVENTEDDAISLDDALHEFDELPDDDVAADELETLLDSESDALDGIDETGTDEEDVAALLESLELEDEGEEAEGILEDESLEDTVEDLDENDALGEENNPEELPAGLESDESPEGDTEDNLEELLEGLEDETDAIDETAMDTLALADEAAEIDDDLLLDPAIEEEEISEQEASDELGDEADVLGELEEDITGDTLMDAVDDELPEEVMSADESILDEAAVSDEDEALEMPESVDEDEETDSVVEASAEEDLEEKSEESLDDVDLEALNDEINDALESLDEEDLASEIDENIEGILEEGDDDFASLDGVALKKALGEEVEDDEESEIREEIEALESSLEEEEEPELTVGRSEFASLNEEALIEAMGEDIDGEDDHPELEEIGAFVDEVPVGEDIAMANLNSGTTEDQIKALEGLISTLKQPNVKEALKGMKMNISISFDGKSE